MTDRKREEAKKVAEAYKARKRSERGLTQEKLAAELGFTQGLVTHWFTGRARIPDATLMLLAERLGFNPLEVRPEIAERHAIASRVLDAHNDSGSDILSSLTPEEFDQVLKYAEFLKSQNAG